MSGRIPNLISDGFAGLEAMLVEIDGVFDATSALDHFSHWSKIEEMGKWVVDLTPSRIGKPLVPELIGRQSEMALSSGYSANYSMVTCGGQSAAPLIFGMNKAAKNGQRLEMSSSISSKSVTILNFAVPSQTTQQMAADAVTQIDTRKPAPPAAFIVIPWEIGNDIYSGQTAQQAYENYRDYCLARQAAGAKVIAITVCDRNQSTPGGLNPTQFRAEIAAANALLTANYSSFADALVNSNDVPALADASNFSDGIHPDGTDLQGLAPLIEAAILEITAQALGGE
jgi:hypothetical protein